MEKKKTEVVATEGIGVKGGNGAGRTCVIQQRRGMWWDTGLEGLAADPRGGRNLSHGVGTGLTIMESSRWRWLVAQGL